MESLKDMAFYGFHADDQFGDVKRRLLYGKAICPIYENDTAAEVVEELVRHNSIFYTNEETKELFPNDKIINGVHMARMRNPQSDKDYNYYIWIFLNANQYDYAMHLLSQIKKCKLEIEDITVPDRTNRKFLYT